MAFGSNTPKAAPKFGNTPAADAPATAGAPARIEREILTGLFEYKTKNGDFLAGTDREGAYRYYVNENTNPKNEKSPRFYLAREKVEDTNK